MSSHIKHTEIENVSYLGKLSAILSKASLGRTHL